MEAKNAYERVLSGFGHKVERYHADNGRFAEKVFVQDVKDKQQNITFCGVGSHHQNGIAERRIKTLGEDARTMLAHGAHLWPEVVNKRLWTFAYKAACRARNEFKLDENLLSPMEKITGIKNKQSVKNEHPLFCPVYTLHKKLQGGIGGIPKWDPRSNAGVYLGHSPEHASNVALVLNLNTGLVSPQYHVVFDDTFSTVEYIRSKKEPSNWSNLCKNHSEDYRMDALPGTNTVEDIRQEMTDWGLGNATTDHTAAANPQPSSEGANTNDAEHTSTAPEGEENVLDFSTETDENRSTINEDAGNIPQQAEEEHSVAGTNVNDNGRPKRTRRIPERY